LITKNLRYQYHIT